MNFLAVALGGAAGSMARYAVQLAMASMLVGAFWGTLAVNLLGSFLIGTCAAISEQAFPSLKPWVMTGFLGGFTTFSSFSLEKIAVLCALEKSSFTLF